MELPSFSNYGGYASENYGAHTLRFNLGPISIWYSYKTVVAFRVGLRQLRVLDYKESQTTRKHLNMIDGGAVACRLDKDEFQKLWDKEVQPYLRGKQS